MGNLDEKIDIEALLREGRTVQLVPQGNSMFPMFVDGRGDAAIIGPITDSDIKTGEVALYRRDTGLLVLHRICRVDGSGVYMVGDNQIEVEGPLRREQLIGVLYGFIRRGHHISAHNPIYIIASRLWLMLRPVRHMLSRPVGVVYRRIKGS